MTRTSMSWMRSSAVRRGAVAAGVVVGLGVLMRLMGSRMRNIDWAKAFEQMPDSAPPKWLFRNISAIRENTDRILQTLETGQPSATVRTSALP